MFPDDMIESIARMEETTAHNTSSVDFNLR